MATGNKKSTQKASKYETEEGHSYLTKRLVVNNARRAGLAAAKNAMQVMGFIVVAQGNNVVKKYADGRTEIISPIG